jgi:hypothetical protein
MNMIQAISIEIGYGDPSWYVSLLLGAEKKRSLPAQAVGI